MQRFSARLVKEGFGATAMTMPNDLELTPLTWSASDRGGCKEATLDAAASAESLAYLCGWVGDRVEIFNEHGEVVWWGVLWDLQVTLGDVSIDISLDNVYNRVKVLYSYRAEDGSENSAETAWAEDANSVARYGAREMLYGLPVAFSESAETVRDTLLARMKAPGPIISTQSGDDYSARLTARGIWEKADVVYFRNPDGLLEHTDGSGTQVLGSHYTSTGISFGNVGGSEADDAYDDMYDSANGLAALTPGTRFFVEGAAGDDNLGAWEVDTLHSAGHVQVTSSGFEEDAAGPSIRISLGEGPGVDTIQQSFQVPTAWTVTHVALNVRRINVPDDNLILVLAADGGGSPGAILTSKTVVGSTLFTGMTWTEFEWNEHTPLSANTTYWLQVYRSGSATLSHGYEVGLDEGLGYEGGLMKVEISGNYVTRDPDADLSFRLIGQINSTAQLEKALEAVTSFTNIIVGVDSNIPVRQYSDDERTALEEIEEMLDAGTSDGQRLVAWVTQDKSVVVATPELSSSENLILGADGQMRYPNGGRGLYAPGKLVYGRYVDVDNIMLLDAVGIRAVRGPAVYVQESEYDAQSGRMTIMSEGAPSAWSALKINKG